MANMPLLVIELSTDPLTRGYAGMSDSEVVTSLYTVDRTYKRATVSGADLYNAIDETEWQALSADDKATIDRITQLGGDIQVQNSARVKSQLVGASGIFDNQTTTFANFVDLANPACSRVVELGLGDVTEGDVVAARAQF
jgi:hypothetical protein